MLLDTSFQIQIDKPIITRPSPDTLLLTRPENMSVADFTDLLTDLLTELETANIKTISIQNIP